MVLPKPCENFAGGKLNISNHETWFAHPKFFSSFTFSCHWQLAAFAPNTNFLKIISNWYKAFDGKWKQLFFFHFTQRQHNFKSRRVPGSSLDMQLVYISDGSGSKIFDLGRVGQAIYGLDLGLENFP